MSDSRANIYYFSVGQGEPIMILHGGPGLDHTYLLPHLEPLSGKYQLIFYDQRASGQSEGHPVAAEITPARFTEDLEALRRGLQLEKVHLLGHGWGALLALRYAAMYPKQVRSLILLNPMPLSLQGRHSFLRNSLEALSPKEREKLTALACSEGVLRGEQEAMQAYLTLWFSAQFGDREHRTQLQLALSPQTAKRCLLIMNLMMNALERHRLVPEEARIDVPALLVVGEKEPLSSEELQRFCTLLPQNRLERIEGVGHLALVEARERILSLIGAFLES